MVLAKDLLVLQIVKRLNLNRFLMKQRVKKAKRWKPSHAYKLYANTYNVETLNLFNPEIQFKDTESAIENKSKDLLTEFKVFQFVVT